METNKLQIAIAKKNAEDMVAKAKAQLDEALAARAAKSSAVPEIVFERAGINPVDEEQKIVLDWYGKTSGTKATISPFERAQILISELTSDTDAISKT